MAQRIIRTTVHLQIISRLYRFFMVAFNWFCFSIEIMIINEISIQGYVRSKSSLYSQVRLLDVIASIGTEFYLSAHELFFICSNVLSIGNRPNHEQ